MPSYAIFIGFPADDWRGPAILHWEPGLVEKNYLAMKAGEDGENGGEEGRWVGCRFDDLEQVRFCDVTDGEAPRCFQAEIAIRNAGVVYAYVSKDCLTYIRNGGVSVEDMEDDRADACRSLWATLADSDAELSQEMRALVNEPLA